MTKKIEEQKAAEKAAVQESKQAGSRPTGSTNESTIDADRHKKGSMLALTEHYKIARDSTNKCLAYGTYKRLHDKVIKEFNLDQLDFEITYDRVANRIWNNVTKTKRGPDSFVASIEPYLVTFAYYQQEAG